MMNRKMVVVPKLEKKAKAIIVSPEFIVIRPKDPKDAYYIAGVLRTDIMLQYMYSKTRGGTPSRYRLSESDFKVLDFPISDEADSGEKAKLFGKALKDYHKIVTKAEENLIKSHSSIEKDF
jgi:type I restriction enzyme M protein